MVGFSQETGGGHLGWNQGYKPPYGEENPGSWHRQSLGGQVRPRVHSRYHHVKQEYHEHMTPKPPTFEPRLPPPRG